MKFDSTQAEAKAKRDAKKAAKGKPISKKKSKENLAKLAEQEAAAAARVDESEADRLAREEHIIATFASQKEQHAHAKDISVRRGVFDARRLRERTRWVVSFRILGAFRARRPVFTASPQRNAPAAPPPRHRRDAVTRRSAT